jgi:macrolide phosphotransferase
VTRSPLFLAALASSAVPGLDPVTVEGVRRGPDDLFEVAYLRDTQDRRWVVRAPVSQAAGAMLEDVTTLGTLLSRRLDVAVPTVRGQVVVPEGRAVVYLRLPGRPLDFSALPPGPLAGEVGRTLARVHNLDHLLYDEAGRPAYDAEAHRRRQLSELDRAAATGHVPTALLNRWEDLLEDVSLWRFAPCPIHGSFTGENVLAGFSDDADASSGTVHGVLAWEEARVGDPADDFAELVTLASPDALDSVLEGYAHERHERPDAGLVRRARLAGEMASVRLLLRAVSAGDVHRVDDLAEQLRDLDESIEADDRRHADEDAAREERRRAERAEAFAAAEAAAGRSRPESLPDDAPWDATVPHDPFASPVTGTVATGVVAQGPDDPDGVAAEGDGVVNGVVDGAVEAATAAGPGDEGEGVGDRTGAAVPHTDEVAVVDRDDSPFEIDEAEALPPVDDTNTDTDTDTDTDAAEVRDADGTGDPVVDEHEGASDFVPVRTDGSGDRPARTGAVRGTKKNRGGRRR